MFAHVKKSKSKNRFGRAKKKQPNIQDEEGGGGEGEQYDIMALMGNYII